MMTKEDFESIADAIYNTTIGNSTILVKEDLIETLAGIFEECNSTFDRNKFEKACRGEN